MYCTKSTRIGNVSNVSGEGKEPNWSCLTVSGKRRSQIKYCVHNVQWLLTSMVWGLRFMGGGACGSELEGGRRLCNAYPVSR